MRSRSTHARTPLGLGLLLLLLLSLVLPSAAPAQTPGVGMVTGKVTDSSGKPLAYANILIVGTSWGAFSLEDGSFKIPNVPPGTYTVAVSMIGYDDQRVENVQLASGGTASVAFKIKERPVGSLQEVEVVARRDVIQKRRTDTSHQINTKDVTSLPVNELSEVIGLKAGVIARADGLHFRGGRANEVQYQVDGVPVRDPLVGRGASLATLAVENVEQIMGGLDAQYGNAQSGVVNYKTKEGTDQFQGEVYYMTDDYGQPDNTYDNLDKVFLGGGGPTPIKNLTYYVSGEGTFSDDYPKTARRRNHYRILNFISVGDRKTNQVRYQGKLAYRPRSDQKITFEMLQNQSHSDTYMHNWSRVGYVQTYFDTTTTGEVALRHGRWSPTALDSTYQYYNAAEHTPTTINNFNQMKLIWSHTIDAATFYTLRLNRNYFYNDSRVQGKQPWEYEGNLRDNFFNYTDRTSEQFYVIAGDYPTASTRETSVYIGKADLTKKVKRHTMQTGIEATYNDMRYTQVDNPAYSNALGEIGTRTRYHYYNPEGAYYLQDRWEHEGMVLNMGLRYDLFSVGQQIEISQVQQRVKQQISPRIGIAYPISDRDVFSFHYGRFYQIPDRRYIFDNTNLYDGRTRGNPNLTNETTVSYQAGIQHLFSDMVSGQFSVYYKDIFGLLDTELQPASGSVGNLRTYVNKAYASARGFEATLSRRFANNFQGEINYGFGVATGVASDPNAQAEQTYAYLPISEQALDWDIRHTLSVEMMLAEPGNWLASFIWQFESGSPYTPYSRNTRELKPEVINSRRMPSTTSLDIQAEKYYQVWGQRFKIFLQSRNVLDVKNITNLSPGNYPGAPGRADTDYETYYTETGKGGGAYVGEDTNGDGIGDWVPLNDPRVFGDPRSVKMGISYEF